MTIVLSYASSMIIAMTTDSAITIEIGDRREYHEGQKSFFFSGVGCVTTWGSRDHNRIWQYLTGIPINPKTHNIEDLSEIVFNYLTREYRPHELGLDDVGYHVAGFDAQKNPRLWHIYYGFERPKPPDQTIREYKKRDHSPIKGSTYWLYNGRNDLAFPIIHTLIQQINSQGALRIDLRNPIDIAYFCDFVARFASEFTPEVGPPFLTYLIGVNNNSIAIKNEKQIPLNRDEIQKAFERFGARVESE